MSSRPSSFKKSGGFLNNVDGIIADYVFTDEFAGEPFKAGRDPKTGKEKFHSLYFRLSARADGADETVSTTLFAGGANDFSISEDGKSIWDSEYLTEEAAMEAGGDARSLGAHTALGKFITSLVQAGFPETHLPDDRINYESIVGTRVRFVQRKDDESTKKLGKRKDRKTGKEYDRTDILVDQVYELPAAGSAAIGLATRATPPAAPDVKPLGRPRKMAVREPASTIPAPANTTPGTLTSDIDDLTTTTLMTILAEEEGTFAKNKLTLRVIKALMMHPRRQEVWKRMLEDSFLIQDDVPWTYAKDTGLITLKT